MELLTICTFIFVYLCAQTEGKECTGLSMAPSYTKRDNMSEYLMKVYGGCTVVKNNVEIIKLEEPIDPTFLDTIEEVRGCIYFKGNSLEVISMKRLKVIKGRPTCRGNYGIYVANNNKLRSVLFPSLKEVIEGKVFFKNNTNLCHVDTIDWRDITFTENSTNVILNDTRHCPPCRADCSSCWSEEVCQNIWRTSCKSHCPTGCLDDGTTCCSQQCLTGCHDDPEKCYQCKHFRDADICRDECPKGKLHYSISCLDKCPNDTFQHKRSCVLVCPDNHKVSEDRECLECDDGKECQTVCSAHSLDYKNITKLANCTNIDGAFEILNGRVNRTENSLVPHFESSLSNIKEISGTAFIQGKHVNFTDLHFLRNLEIVKGSKINTLALMISYTYLRSLKLTKLREIGGELRIKDNEYLQSLDLISLAKVGGPVTITNNKELCYIENRTFDGISSHVTVAKNKDPEECIKENKVCHAECKGGCWGPGNEMCRFCHHYNFEGACVPSCDLNVSFEADRRSTCDRCHPQCHGCFGKGPRECIKCINAMEKDECVERCSADHFEHEANKTCLSCSSVCKDGCSGSLTTRGKGGCNSCHLLFLQTNECIVGQCPRGYFLEKLPEKTCKPCNSQCMSCKGEGVSPDVCTCRHVEYRGQCVEKCPTRHYADAGNVCQMCHSECVECHGPGNDSCHSCKHVRISLEREINTNDSSIATANLLKNVSNPTEKSPSSPIRSLLSNSFYCDSNCPPDLPDENETIVGNEVQRICYLKPQTGNSIINMITNPKAMTNVIVVLIVGLSVAVLVIVLVSKRQKTRSDDFKAKLEAQIKSNEAQEMNEVLTPTDVCPDLANLRLIKEVELERGQTIGSGAFGTVYVGIWRPENENKRVAVAIKVLLDDSSSAQHTELLEEARVMASVKHSCCIRILAVCLGRRMMLITPLVVHGSLLDYIRKEGNSLGSHTMLKWATQIAAGMNYLELKGIVHRDLAARNILVQGVNQVKITDFGLAKLLTKEAGFLSEGGKVPVKWLALESIQHRIYTHKSDVWSYGVTLWELFTYGERPYPNVSALDVAKHLEAGERLPQPSICTIDVFMVLFKCWEVDAACRPTFHELELAFAAMSQNSENYLIIPGDRRKRIPSDFIENNRAELLRQMRLSDSEDLISGEDYLDPVFTFPKRTSSKRKTPLLTKVDEEEETIFQASPVAYTNSPPISLRPSLEHQSSSLSSGSIDGTFSHLVAATAAFEGSRERKSSDRYLSDLKEPFIFSTSNEKDLLTLKKSFANVKNSPEDCQAIVDGDNYLKCFQKGSTTMTMENPEYMEQSLTVEGEEATSLSKVTGSGNAGGNSSSPYRQEFKKKAMFKSDYYNEFSDTGKVSVIGYNKLELS